MKFPWVSKKQHIAAIKRMAGYVQALTTENDQLRQASLGTHRRLAELQFRYEQLERREKNERWRRLRAEGELAYKDDRIKRVLGLPIWPKDESGVKKAI